MATELPPKASGQAPEAGKHSWQTHAQQELQEQPQRLEETAKFLVAIVSISLTIFIAQAPEDLPDWTDTWLIAATLLWMVSVLLSFFVFFPTRYRFNLDEPASIAAAYARITKRKYVILVLAVVFFFVALALAAICLVGGVVQGS